MMHDMVPADPLVFLIGAVVAALVLAPVTWFTIWLRNSLRPKPTHDSETPDGEKRHAERMEGLRALADDVKALEDDGQAEQQARQDGQW